jgi:hypothetical protein
MKRKSLVVGIVIGIVVVVGGIGAATAFDRLVAPGTPEVTVERINDTHAAVIWTTDVPTHGHLSTSIQAQCDGSWLTINSINDSSLSRTHHVIAPIYELNRSRIQPTLARFSENSSLHKYSWESPVRYEVSVSVYRDGSGAGKTIYSRTLNQSCQTSL